MLDKIYKILVLVLVLLLVVFYFLFQYWRDKARELEAKPPVYIEVPGTPDTLKIVKEIPVPYEVIIKEKEWDSILVHTKIDTQAVINDWLKSARTYKDVIKDDSSAYLAYELSVFRNELQDISFDFANRQPYYRTKTERVDNYFHQLFGHVGLFNREITVGATLTTKRGLYLRYDYSLESGTHNGAIGIRFAKSGWP